MSQVEWSDLSQYYKRELSYLRGQGLDFASRYPKVAASLALHGAESQDPHTERLIESVAFLAARVHRDLDQQMPQVATALLDNLCPSLVQPVPSMSIAQLRLDPSQGRVTAGFKVAKHTKLQARTTQGRDCSFQSSWDTMLWPLQITHAGVDADAVLRITLECADSVDFSQLEIDSLRLHLQGEWSVTAPLYDALVAGVRSIGVVCDDGVVHRLPLDAWSEVGYAQEDSVLPLPTHAHPAYGLLQEYFAFPRKFHFFDIGQLRGRLGRGKRCDLVFQLDRPARALRTIGAENFQLGCTPIVNLFARISEPLVLDQRHYEYLLVSDRQRDAFTEVHSIRSVVASDPDAGAPVQLPHFSAVNHFGHGARSVFWTSRRQHSLRDNISGTDVLLSFVDQTQGLTTPAQPVVYAHLWCTNRRLAQQVPPGAKLLAEGPPQPVHIKCLYEPTEQKNPPLGSDTLWRLVSLLTMNHQSLVGDVAGCERLREMLHLFVSDSRRDHAPIRGLTGLSARTVTAHVGDKAWRGYCRGTHLDLVFDDEAFVGGSSLLMSAVLARFFAMYTSMNSFVRLAVLQGDDIKKQWPPMSGRQVVL
ncbi:MAG: type VI secretion system baseplate subunit TssF [Comamonas sp.]